jgi:hypothetical protein
MQILGLRFISWLNQLMDISMLFFLTETGYAFAKRTSYKKMTFSF